MIQLRKYNERKRQYEPYEVPDEWHVSCYETDMDTKVNCCQCGREVRYGECFTSMQVHTPMGMGYAVCERCYFDKEVPERREAEGW